MVNRHALTLVPFLCGLGLLAAAPETRAVGPSRPSSRPAPVVSPQTWAALEAQGTGDVFTLVVLAEPAGAARVGRRAALFALQEHVIQSLPPQHFKITYRYEHFAALAGRVTATGLARLAANPRVRHVGLDAGGSGFLDDSRPALEADRVHAGSGLDGLGITGEGVTVAVLDTGVDTDHPDLVDNLAPGAFHFLEQGQDTGPGAEDVRGHGTAVAGIITSGGVVAGRGIAPDADILAVKVLSERVFASDIAAGIDYVLTLQNDFENLAAINLSLGIDVGTHDCTCDDTDAAAMLLQAAIAAARAAGIVTFVSPGNSGGCNRMFNPACVSAAVSVGAVHLKDIGRFPPEGTYRAAFGAFANCFDASTKPGTVQCYTDRSECLDLLAPGLVIAPALGGGKRAFIGTSAAAPHCSAIAALMATVCPAGERIVELLKDSGEPTADGCAGDRFPSTIHAFRAVSAMLAETPCNDCNGNFVEDAEDLSTGSSADCDASGTPDDCDIAAGAASDCNANGVPDDCDIAAGAARDCDANRVPDDCDIAHGILADCDLNGTPDTCELRDDPGADCDGDGRLDACNLADAPEVDCNGNGTLDACDLASGTAEDRNSSGVPDECEPEPFARGDCNADGVLAISDGVTLLTFLFLGGLRPGCLAACDTDGDGRLDLGTVVYHLNFLFFAAAPPRAPFPDCGVSGFAGDQALGCKSLPRACFR